MPDNRVMTLFDWQFMCLILVTLESKLTYYLSCCHPHLRLSRYQQFKDFQRRILVATNLFGRGMDIERVNIVFNYDMPEDSDTYLHRVSPALIILCHRYQISV